MCLIHHISHQYIKKSSSQSKQLEKSTQPYGETHIVKPELNRSNLNRSSLPHFTNHAYIV